MNHFHILRSYSQDIIYKVHSTNGTTQLRGEESSNNPSVHSTTFGELENEATRNEECAAEQNPWWHADLFGTMNLEQVTEDDDPPC